MEEEVEEMEEEEKEGEGMVSLDVYARLTKAAGGLYELFQKKADPGTYPPTHPPMSTPSSFKPPFPPPTHPPTHPQPLLCTSWVQ